MGVSFEIQVNGEPMVAAGRSALDVLTALLTYVRSRNELELRASGLHRHEDGSSEHVDWIVRALAVGDEIRIRITDSDGWSEPISITRDDDATREQAERAYYERLKQKYDGEPGGV